MRQKKLPIWVKKNNKFELIPYHEMTTFEDGTKGYYWTGTTPDFIRRFPQHFRVDAKRPFAEEKWRYIFTEKPRWIWRKKAKQLDFSLVIVGGVVTIGGLFSIPFSGTPAISLAGAGLMILSCVANVASIGLGKNHLGAYLEDKIDGA